MIEQQYIDFKGTQEQLKTFIEEIYDDFEFNCSEVVDVLIKEETSSSITSNSNDEDDVNNENNYKLYFRDTHYHVCAKKIVFDMMITLLISVFTNTSPIAPVLSAIWTSRKSILKIRDDYFCIYLKLYFYGLTNGFSIEELNKCCKKKKTNECNCDTTLFKCPFKVQKICKLYEEDIYTQIGFMLKDGVIEKIDSKTFRLTR